MAFASSHKVRGAFGLLCLMLGAGVCLADDCGPAAYAYEDRVVLFACSRSGSPELRVIQLDDNSALKVTGRVDSAAKRSFDAVSHYNNFLMTVTWDSLEIYDLADAAHPHLAGKLQLKKQVPIPGYSRIEQIEKDKFLVIAAIGAAELTAQGEPAKWTLNEVAVTPQIREKTSSRPAEWRFRDQNEHDIVVRDGRQFRYELSWREKTKPGEVFHRQYLRKVDKSTQRAASELLLGESLETID